MDKHFDNAALSMPVPKGKKCQFGRLKRYWWILAFGDIDGDYFRDIYKCAEKIQWKYNS
ncbi:hypothetical protein [Arthrospiribacter ruber]|uniref:hypothetical protein n=1 Tax=Arthrospiribacter ruber TaxID=2487934 RepID=UPI001C5B52B0|nr:hypothetical protein [Arthrospiribacter ruber]